MERLVSTFSRVLLLVIAALVTTAVQYLFTASGGRQNHTQVSSLVTLPSETTPTTTLANVGGHDDAKRELRASVILPMRSPHVFYDPNVRTVRPPRGVLLHGPPGTGKTMLARAAAHEARVPLITLHSAALESKWFGETPKLLNAVFTEARTRYAPCLIFMDEIDGLGRARSEQDQSCVYSFKCELLRNMDTLDGGAPVVVLACTNHVHALDPALRRRFQRTLHIGAPQEAERASILRALLKDETSSKKGSVADALARRTPGMTGADLTSLYEAASALRMHAATEEDLESVESAQDLVRRLGPLTTQHFEEAARRLSKPLMEEEEEAPNT